MKFKIIAVADPGFPRGGSANSQGGGAPTCDFAKFSQKTAWNWKNLARAFLAPPLDPPLLSDQWNLQPWKIIPFINWHLIPHLLTSWDQNKEGNWKFMGTQHKCHYCQFFVFVKFRVCQTVREVCDDFMHTLKFNIENLRTLNISALREHHQKMLKILVVIYEKLFFSVFKLFPVFWTHEHTNNGTDFCWYYFDVFSFSSNSEGWLGYWLI